MAKINTKTVFMFTEGRDKRYRQRVILNDKILETNQLFQKNLYDKNGLHGVTGSNFQSKSRIRRQYNPEDDNIADLFRAIRKHNTGNPPLNNLDEIKGLLTKVTNVNDIDSNHDDNTPLHVAVLKGHKDIVELLLAHSSIDVTIKNKNNQTPLELAKTIDDVVNTKEAIINLLNSVPSGTGHVRQPSLPVSAQKEPRITKPNEDNQPSAMSHEQSTVLDAKVVEWVNELGLSLPLPDGSITLTDDQLEKLKKFDRGGNTPLLEAVSTDHKELINFLIRCGVDVNDQNSKTKQRAIDITWENGYYEAMLALLEADSYFPKKFKLDDLYQDDDIPEALKNFVREREDFHESLKNNQLEDIKNYISNHKLSRFLNSKHQPALKTAVEYANVEAVAVLLGISSPLPTGRITLTPIQRNLLQQSNEEGNRILLLSIAAKHGKNDHVEFLIRCGINLNCKNTKNQRAIDLAYKNKHYEVVLTLLQADSDFPVGFNLNQLNEDEDNQKHLKQFVEERNRLHAFIEKGELYSVKESTTDHKSKYYFNSEGQSAALTAIKQKQYDIYGFLKSKGARFKNNEEENCITELSSVEQDSLKHGMIAYFHQSEQSHILYLTSKSKSKNQRDGFEEKVKDFYTKLDGIPEVSTILKVVQYADYLEIIFDFGNPNIRDVDPTASDSTQGTTDYKAGRLYIAAKMEEAKVLGTLAHELAHLAMQIIYRNDCNPYGTSDKDRDRMNKFLKIAETIKAKKNVKKTIETSYNSNDDSPLVILSRTFGYKEDEQPSELIVRIVHILAQYGEEGRKWIRTEVPELFDYHGETNKVEGEVVVEVSKNTIADCDNFAKNSFFIKPRNAVKLLNQGIGELNKIQEHNIRFTNPIDLTSFFDNLDKNILILRTKSTVLSSINIYQTLQATPSYASNDHYLIVDFNRYIKNKEEINKAFYFETTSLLIVVYPPGSTDKKLPDVLNDLSDILTKKLAKKNVFIVQEERISGFKNELDKIPGCSNKYLEQADRSFTLNDLRVESQHKLLKKPITFQGEKIRLNQLIDEHSKDIIDSDTLDKLITGQEIAIGHQLTDLGEVKDYYIDRKFYQIEIKTDIETDSTFQDNLVYTKEDFDRLCKEKPDANIHWLKSEPGKLIWQQSQGSVSRLRKYVQSGGNRMDYYSESDFLDQSAGNKVGIISDRAGMGKTTVLTSLSQKVKNKSSGRWVIRINLIKHTYELGELQTNNPNLSFYNAINFLLNKLLKLNDGLEKKLLENGLRSGSNDGMQVVIFLDGFDEISPSYKDIVINLLGGLKQTNVERLLVTTRPNMMENLERKLGVLAYDLKPFSKDTDQVDFLVKFWKNKFRQEKIAPVDDQKLEIYGKELITRLSVSTSGKQTEFTNIPLHTRMLAEVFYENKEGKQEQDWQGCKDFLKTANIPSKKPVLPSQFNIAIADLYERFVKKIFYDIHFKEKREIDFTKPGIKKVFDRDYKEFIKQHQELALYTLLNNEDFTKLSSTNQENINRWVQDIQRGDENQGIIDQIIDDKPHFTHATFAEYFASFAFAEKMVIDGTLEILNTVLPNTSQIFINSIIKQLEDTKRTEVLALLEGKPLINFAAKNGYLNVVKALLTSGLDVWPQPDKKGRTPLHYAARYDHRNIVAYLLNYHNDILGEDILEHGNFKKEEYRTSKLVGFINQEDIDGKTAPYYAAKNNKLETACDLLLKGADSNNLNEYLRPLVSYVIKQVHGAYANQDHKLRPIVEKLLLQDPSVVSTLDSGYELPRLLSYFFRNGRIEVIIAILNTINDPEKKRELLNQEDNSYRPLDRVNLSKELSDNDRLKITKYLVDNGGIETKHHVGHAGYGASHYRKILQAAARDGHIKTFQHFVSQDNANLNIHLYQALQNHNFNIIQYLYDNHKAAIKYKGNTPLHSAIDSGADLKTIKYLIDRGEDVNAKNDLGESPLFQAIDAKRRLNIIKYLIDKGANVNMENDSDETPLYYAIKNEYTDPMGISDQVDVDIIKYLLVDCHANIPPLVRNQAEFFQNPNGFDLDLTDLEGMPRLHKAIQSNDIDWSKFIIRKGGDINLTDRKGKTPLHWATQLQQIEIVELLLQYGAMYDVADSQGNTPRDLLRNPNALNEKGAKIVWLLDTLDQLFNSENLIRDLNDRLLSGTTNGGQKDFGPYGKVDPYPSGVHNPTLFILNARNNQKNSLLHLATNQNDEQALIALLEASDDCLKGKREATSISSGFHKNYQPRSINAVNNEGNMPIHIAARKGNAKIVGLLLKTGAIFDAQNQEGRTPKELSTDHTVNQLFQSVNAFFNAVDAGNKQIIQNYINEQEELAYIKIRDNNDKTALHRAVSSGKGNIDIIQLLLENNADLDALDVNDYTPLHFAVENDNLEVVKLLLKQGANFNVKNKKGKLPFELTENESSRLLGSINELFIGIESDNPEGIINHFKIIDIQRTYSISIETIINVLDKHGNTLLHYAAENGYLYIVEFLLQHGAIFNSENNFGLTPPASNKHIVDLFKSIHKIFVRTNHMHQTQVDMKIITNVRNNEGMTILHKAVQEGNNHVVIALLKAGANIDAKNMYNNNRPLDYAKQGYTKNILESNIELLQAVRNNDVDNVNRMIAKDAVVSPSILHLAVQHGYYNIFKRLLKHVKGNSELANLIKISDEDGNAALHLALKNGHYKVAKTLLTYAKNINDGWRTFRELILMPDNSGNTPFEVVNDRDKLKKIVKPFIKKANRENASPEIVELLRIINNEINPRSRPENIQHFMAEGNTLGLSPSASSCSSNSSLSRRKKRDICNENEPDDLFPYEPLQETIEASARKNARLYTNIAYLFSLQDNMPENIQSDHVIHYNRNIGDIMSEGILDHSTREEALLKQHYSDAETFVTQYPKDSLLDVVDGEINPSDGPWLLDDGKHTLLVSHAGDHYKIYSQDYNYRVVFQTKPGVSFSNIAQFANAFFRWRSGSSEYQIFTLSKNLPQAVIDTLQQAKFWHPDQVASDLLLLDKGSFSHIEQIPAKVVRELFFLDGQVPELTTLHEDFFRKYVARLSLRVASIHTVLPSLSSEESNALTRLIQRYNFPIDTVYLNSLPADKRAFLEAYHNKVDEHLKQSDAISVQDLSDLSWQILDEKMSEDPDISPKLKSSALKNVKEIHGSASNRMHAMGSITQTLFFLPDILRSVNTDDYQSLARLSGMVGGDMVLNKLYGGLINKLEPVLSSSRISLLSKLPVTSPIFKVLTIHSIVELTKELNSLPAGSERKRMIKHQLGEQYFTVGLMVAEMFGFELGPLWIGLMAEQMIYGAISLRKQYQLDISFGEAFLMNLGFEKEKLESILTERGLVDMNLSFVQAFSNQTETDYAFALVKVPQISNSGPQAGHSVIDFNPYNQRVCMEDNVFLEASTGYKRMVSVEKGHKRNCVGKAPLHISGQGLSAFYVHDKTLHGTRNMFTIFDPSEGNLELKFTKSGLQALDKLGGVSSYNVSNPYVVTTSISRKPYPDQITLPWNSHYSFRLIDHSRRIISKYYIDGTIPFTLHDDADSTSILFLNNKVFNGYNAYINGSTEHIALESIYPGNRITGNISLKDKHYVQLNLNATLIKTLELNFPQIELLYARGKSKRQIGKLKVGSGVMNAKLMLGPNIQLSVGNSTNNNWGLETTSISPSSMVFLELLQSGYQSYYSFKIDALQPTLNGINQMSRFFPSKFYFNCVQQPISGKELCELYNRDIRKNTIQLIGKLNGENALLTIEDQGSTLEVDKGVTKHIEVIHYKNSITLATNLLTFKKVINPNDYHTSYYHHNIVKHRLLSHWLILKFRSNTGDTLFHHFKYDNVTNPITINGIDHIVYDHRIYAKLNDTIDGNQLLKLNDKRTLSVFIDRPFKNSTISCQDRVVKIGNQTLYNLPDQTTIIFQESSDKTLPLSFKLLVDSFTPVRQKREVSSIDSIVPAASSASKPTSFLSTIWEASNKLINKITHSFNKPTSITSGPTVVNMDNRLVANTDINGLLTWATLLARKWTGYRPKIVEIASYDLHLDIELDIQSQAFVDAFIDKLEAQFQAFGIEDMAIFDSPTLYAQAIKTVNKKLSRGEIASIISSLFEQILEQNSSKREELAQLEKQFLEQEASLEEESQEESEMDYPPSKPDINLLKQEMCSMPLTDHCSDNNNTVPIGNAYNLGNLFAHTIEDESQYRKCGNL